MFCDMVGSSALSTRLDPEEQSNVIAAFHTCCADEIKALGGMVAQYLGDGVLAYFGYPTAHENDAERAILAGLAILKSVASLRPVADVAMQTFERANGKEQRRDENDRDGKQSEGKPGTKSHLGVGGNNLSGSCKEEAAGRGSIVEQPDIPFHLAAVL